MERSCFSKRIVASRSTTATSANLTALIPSETASFSSFSSMRPRFLRPAVSKILKRRPCHSRSRPMASRVMPASGPTSSRSSPRNRLISVDLPAFGRPTTAIRSGRLSSISPSAERGLIIVAGIGFFDWLEGQQWPDKGRPALRHVRRKRHRIAKTKRECVISPFEPNLAFCLVGKKDHRLSGTAKQLREVPIIRHNAGSRIHDKEHDIRLRQWRPRSAISCGLLAVSAAASSRPAVSITSNLRSPQPRFADATIPRDARFVVDKRQLLADKPVEKPSICRHSGVR